VGSNLQKRLDRIEKGLHQFLEAQNPTGPVYVAEGDSAPEGRDAITIVMHWVEAEHPHSQSLSQVGTSAGLGDKCPQEITRDPPPF
jgi:hypothetical protein